nr:hypothetical protein [Saprospiraceae bacterium]
MTNIIFKIKHDLFRYSGKLGFKIFLIHFIKTPGFRFICLHRLCNIYSKFSLIGLLSRFWYKNLQRRYGYQIPLTTKIGKGLFMPHYGNIVFNQAAIIGDNCNI